jgi:hypothetical protein
MLPNQKGKMTSVSIVRGVPKLEVEIEAEDNFDDEVDKHLQGKHDQSSHSRSGKGSTVLTDDPYSKDNIKQEATKIALDRAGQARLDMQRYKVGTQEQENATVDFELYRAASEGMNMAPPAKMKVPTGVKGKAYQIAIERGGQARLDMQRYYVGSPENLQATIDNQLFVSAVNYLGQG